MYGTCRMMRTRHDNPRPPFATTRPMTALLLVVWLALGAGGCTARYVDYAAFIDRPSVAQAAQRYRIAPPDTLMLHSQVVRELDGRRVTVRNDGTLRLPLIGTVDAAGRTQHELAALLARRASRYYRQPDVEVRVVRHASQRVFVFGRVAQPGAQAFDGRNTALGALSRAQPVRGADPTRVWVLTPNGEGGFDRRAVVNLAALAAGRRGASDVALEPGEIVHVPDIVPGRTEARRPAAVTREQRKERGERIVAEGAEAQRAQSGAEGVGG